LPEKIGDIFLRGAPDFLDIHGVVFMYEMVSHSGDKGPRYVLVEGPKLSRQSLDGFAEHHKLMQHADWVFSSSRKAVSSMSRVKSMTRIPVLRMSSRIALSRGMENTRGLQNRLAAYEVPAPGEGFLVDKVDPPAHPGLEFLFHPQMIEETPAGIGGKGYEDVKVALRSKIVTEDGAKQRKLDDFPAAAKIVDNVLWEKSTHVHWNHLLKELYRNFCRTMDNASGRGAMDQVGEP
jgi:hypothetical protein